MLTQQECILTKLLDCGSADLSLLEDIQYDLDEILEDLVDNGCLSFRDLLTQVFNRGLDDLKDVYDNFLSDLQREYSDCPDEELRMQINELGTVDVENDFTWFLNYLDTHVFLNNYDVYVKYFKDEIDSIENNMGFEFKAA